MSGVERDKRRVLFFAEAVTLAHVARPYVLACGLPIERYRVRFACDPRYDRLFKNPPFERLPIESVSSQDFLRALATGSPLYDFSVLQDYVRADLAVIDAFQPDVIVGDFRLSLSVSARLRRVPYLAITNAYWSPYATIDSLVPELPLTRWLGYRLGGALFRLGRPLGFAMHARAHNRLRRWYGIPELGPDVREIYTDGDQVLYADLPDLVPLWFRPRHHHFIGPIQWSPQIAPPSWWGKIGDSHRPLAYVTLGSSGEVGVLGEIVERLSATGITVMAATAGRAEIRTSSSNIYIADYLPGERAAELADFVVCNGGSPTGYQALAAAKAVVGLPSNLDQCLNIAAMKAAGVGEILRIGKLDESAVRESVEAALQLSRSPRLQEFSEAVRAADPVAAVCPLIETPGGSLR